MMRHLIVLAAALACASCGRLLSDPDSTTIKSLIVAGTPPPIGSSSQFTAVAVRADGTSDAVTSQAVWRSSNTAVATVGGDGVVLGARHGTVEISATYQNTRGAFSFEIPATTTFTLSGSITDAATRLAISGAKIVVRDSSGISKDATTNSSGRYSIAALASGQLDVNVQRDGYTTASQSTNLTADLTLDVVLVRVSDCSVIGFDGLARGRFVSYAACGFSVTASTSYWNGVATGDPGPSVQFDSEAQTATAG